MAFGVQIPLSNTLRMVRTDNRTGLLQNFDNTLLQDEDYVEYNDRYYFQKIAGTDEILIQFATDETAITAIVYDLDDNVVSTETANISSVLESTSFDIYDLKFTIAAAGYYYLKMTFGATIIYQSENFQIDGYNTDNILKIEYNTSENDGILYSDSQTFILRFEGRMVECKLGQEKESYTNFNESPETLNSFPTRSFKLTYGPVPRYIAEKFNLALAHELVKVNDVEYHSKEGNEADLIKDGLTVTNMYEGDVTLQQVDYENYESAADDVEPTTYQLLIDEFTGKLIIKDSGTEYYTRYKD